MSTPKIVAFMKSEMSHNLVLIVNELMKKLYHTCSTENNINIAVYILKMIWNKNERKKKKSTRSTFYN